MQWEVRSIVIEDEHSGRMASMLITEALIWHAKCRGHVLLGDPNWYAHHISIDHHNATQVLIFFAHVL